MLRTPVFAAFAFALFTARCAAPLADDSQVAATQLANNAAPLTQRAATEQAGWNALVRWDDMPKLSAGAVRTFSSTEREDSGVWFPYDAGNKDFNNFLAVCGARPALTYQFVDNTVACAAGEEGYLLAAFDGPGYVSRIALGGGTLDLGTTIDSGLPLQPHPSDELIKIYIDDAKDPVYVGRWSDWDKGAVPPFSAPLTGWSSGFILNYVPISFQHRLRVFADALNPSLYTYYYQVTVHSVSATERFDAAALRSESAQAELKSLLAQVVEPTRAADTRLDSQVSLDPDAPRTIWQSTQPGTIEQIALDVSAQLALTQLSLRLFWDDQDAPALDLTLADLFGARLSKESAPEYQTWPMGVTRNADMLQLRLTLPMPYAHSARVVLLNKSPTPCELHAAIVGRSAVPEGAWGSLHALQATRARPELGERFVVADLAPRGGGKYLGTLLYMRGGPNPQNLIPGPMPLNFLEGDDRLEVDGVVSQGTGTEETFNGGWYFSDGRFQSPFAALLHIEQSDPQHGEISALRWNILSDSIAFQEHFRLSYEYGANNPETASEYSAIAFYYAAH